MCGRFGEAGCLARCGFAARAKGESGLANIVRDGLNHVIGRSERLTDMRNAASAGAHSVEWTRLAAAYAPMAVPSSTQCRQPNPRLPRSSLPKLRLPLSPEDLSCSPWRSVLAVPLPLMRKTHQ